MLFNHHYVVHNRTENTELDWLTIKNTWLISLRINPHLQQIQFSATNRNVLSQRCGP